jgi:hypothetical protein
LSRKFPSTIVTETKNITKVAAAAAYRNKVGLNVIKFKQYWNIIEWKQFVAFQ